MSINIIMPLNNLEKKILSDKAIKFATLLHKTFNPTRLELLESRNFELISPEVNEQDATAELKIKH